jgi:hypothetical protein
MKFLYSDTQDYVDPGYDFLNDRSSPGRERYWSDVYAHEFMQPAPYDGLLVSMSAVRQAAGVASCVTAPASSCAMVGRDSRTRC